MSDIAALVADNLDIWTGAIQQKSRGGRSGRKRISLYGIERLRALILDLAVGGRLVQQDPKDEPAKEALERLSRACAAKVKAGLARKPKSIASMPDDLAAMPPGWAWTQLGAIAEISPSNSVGDDAEASFVPMAMISTSISGEHEAEIRRWAEIKKGFTHFADGDLGLAKITPCFENGKAAIFQNLCNGIGAGTTELHVARPWSDDLNRRYILLTMKTGSFLANGEKQMTGTAGQKRVTRAYFEATPLPFPPLAEQRRIVSKVDELMALCDALERESADALVAHQALVEALLATLVNSSDAAGLAANWARLEGHFDTLFTTELSIGALKQTIIDLAVRGKLLEQDAADEPGKVLISELNRAAANMEKEGVIAKRKPINFPSNWEPAFALPTGWAWEYFGNYTAELATGPFGTMIHQSDYVSDGIPLINPSHMVRDKIIEDLSVSLPEEKAAKLESYKLRAGDIVFARRGEVGRLAVVTEREAGWLCGTGSFRARFASHDLQEYLALFFRSRYAREFLGGESVGSTMSNLNHSILNRLPIPIPPLAEQQRIVARVDALMALCDALKARLADAAETRRQLADAIVARAAA
ncbi:MAG: restriction endonuclease subunit S [Sphingomonadales bacterium]|nr:restriction endonuclease subunit S [Sphingomonadales bacterium]